MTKEEADRITALEVQVATLTAEISAWRTTAQLLIDRHDRILNGDHEFPGLGARVIVLEGFGKRVKGAIAAVGLMILGLIGNAIKAFLEAK